jgi:hypothetical protein
MRKIAPRLESLKLDFGECEQLDTSGMLELTKVLSATTQLRSLNLSFLHALPDMKDEDMVSLLDSMSGLDDLREIGLFFSEANNITQASVNRLCEILYQMAPRLTTFCLQLNSDKLGDLAIMTIDQALRGA